MNQPKFPMKLPIYQSQLSVFTDFWRIGLILNLIKKTAEHFKDGSVVLIGKIAVDAEKENQNS